MSNLSPAVRPDHLTQDHLEYLDDLRENGLTNMLGAQPYLMGAFMLTEKEAEAVLLYWMRTFGERHPEVSRRERL